MKSIKPGRGPSKLSMVGGIAAALFGVFWCIMAGAIGAWFMVPFGLIFVGLALYSAKYHHHNVTSEDRYSLVDIVDEYEETDPLQEKYGRRDSAYPPVRKEYGSGVAYCPYCGTSIDAEFLFCPKCGKRLP